MIVIVILRSHVWKILEACLDLIYNSKDLGRDHFVERVERQNGRYITVYAEKLGIGSRGYEIVNI